jgi:hypothetical protein
VVPGYYGSGSVVDAERRRGRHLAPAAAALDADHVVKRFVSEIRLPTVAL